MSRLLLLEWVQGEPEEEPAPAVTGSPSADVDEREVAKEVPTFLGLLSRDCDCCIGHHPPPPQLREPKPGVLLPLLR